MRFPSSTSRLRRVLPAAALTAALGGCAGFSPDGGMQTAQSLALTELGKDVVKVTDETTALTSRDRVASLLKGSMSADSAVQIALLNNRGLQAAYNDLGLAEAQMVAASLPPNPRFAISRLSGRFETEIERQVVGSLFALATLPARAEIAGYTFRSAQLKAAEATFRLAADARRQFYRSVAAIEQVGYLQQAVASSEASSELIKRLGESGGMNKLEQAREHALYAEATAQLAKARLQEKIEREKLARVLGLWGKDTGVRLPSRLPALPGRIQAARDLEGTAMRKRVDLQIARADLDVLAKKLGLTQATRFVNDVDLLVERPMTAPATSPSAPTGTARWNGRASASGRWRSSSRSRYSTSGSRRSRPPSRPISPPPIAGRESGQCTLRSARSLSRLPWLTRDRAALPDADPAPAQDDPGRIPAAVQRHVDRRDDADRRRPSAHSQQRPGRRREARFLDRHGRSEARHHRRRSRWWRSRRRDCGIRRRCRGGRALSRRGDQTMTLSRRNFVGASGFAVAAAGLVSGRAQAASLPEAASTRSAETQVPKAPTTASTTSQW